MSLSNLIRGKSGTVGFATATPATFATQEVERERTVATIATVTVAKAQNPETPRAPTPDEEGELRALIHLCGLRYKFSRDDEAEAWRVVLEVGAAQSLRCYRGMARREGIGTVAR